MPIMAAQPQDAGDGLYPFFSLGGECLGWGQGSSGSLLLQVSSHRPEMAPRFTLGTMFWSEDGGGA